MSSGLSHPMPQRTVRVEILSRVDCPNKGMAITIVERVIRETGILARLDLVEITNEPQAELKRFLGSPTVRVDGRDVEFGASERSDYSVTGRIYYTDRGICGWPEESWVRDALLRAAAIALVPPAA